MVKVIRNNLKINVWMLIISSILFYITFYYIPTDTIISLKNNLWYLLLLSFPICAIVIVNILHPIFEKEEEKDDNNT